MTGFEQPDKESRFTTREDHHDDTQVLLPGHQWVERIDSMNALSELDDLDALDTFEPNDQHMLKTWKFYSHPQIYRTA